MKRRIESQRKWVRDHYLPESISEYESIEGKLKLIDIVIKSNWINKIETNKLQCLGITLGDALVQKLGLRWIEVEDDFGSDPALKFGDTSIIIFPLTMISKRIEDGEKVEVFELYNKFVDKINEIITKAD
jgi:hypothetical protein